MSLSWVTAFSGLPVEHERECVVYPGCRYNAASVLKMKPHRGCVVWCKTSSSEQQTTYYFFWITLHSSLNKPSRRNKLSVRNLAAWLSASSEHLILLTTHLQSAKLAWLWLFFNLCEVVIWSWILLYKSGSLVSRDILLWNIKSINSLARYWTSAIRISVAAKDSEVILEVLPGVSFFFFQKQCWLVNTVVWLCCSWNKRMFLFSCCGSIVLLNSPEKWVTFRSCADLLPALLPLRCPVGTDVDCLKILWDVMCFSLLLLALA